jgi:glutamate---cysteine ligase / carboxylate-amine ligase
MSDDEDEPPLLHAFMGYGIELEYMIVDRGRLSVLPVADRLLRAVSGSEGNEVNRGMLGWSNEMVLHVIELKNLRPTTSLSLLPDAFQSEVQFVNRMLQPMGACHHSLPIKFIWMIYQTGHARVSHIASNRA